MPTSLEGSTYATLLLAALAVVSYLGTRRWGTGPAPDPVVVAYRDVRRWWTETDDEWTDGLLLASADQDDDEEGRKRWFRRRRRDEQPRDEDTAPAPDVAPAGETHPQVEAEPEQEAEDLSPVPSSRPRLDHVPFDRADAGDEGEERMRDRWKRGLKKTRDFLNRDVREVFGTGPIEESFDALEEALVRADVGVPTAVSLSDELRGHETRLATDTLMPALKQKMRGVLQDADRRLRVNTEGLSVWLVVGVNGTGKTTTIAKLTQHARTKGFSVCLAAADTFRAAAIEQLETWGERIGVDVIRQHAGADPAAVAFDAVAHAKARRYDLLIVDTAGRLHTRSPLMEELRKVRRVIEREPGVLTETLLVLDATTGQNGIAQARAFGEAVDVTGIVLAKLDGTAKGGITFAVERELQVPVKVVGLGEQATDLAPFDPDEFIDALFEDEAELA